MEVQMRKLEAEDLNQIYTIAKETLAPLWAPKEYEYFLCQPSSYSWGVDDSNGLACFLLCLTTGAELDIVSIATRKKSQGRGLAERLLKGVLADSGCNLAVLEVDPNNEPAVRLYLKVGFVVQGLRKKYYQGKKDAWIMKWTR